MDLSHFTDLPPLLHLHLWSAVLALTLGPVAIYRHRRDALHKIAGYVWVTAMALAALSSFGPTAQIVPLVGGFGVIHGLAVLLLTGLWQAVAAIRAGQVASHRAQMRALYWQALAVAGLFTLLPGRLLNDALFGHASRVALWGISLVGIAILAARAGKTMKSGRNSSVFTPKRWGFPANGRKTLSTKRSCVTFAASRFVPFATWRV